ncbi:MAG TPA: ABC transporter permease DevC [Candidatus Binatia bacterium]|nr:ABC transporter permease DevC [Candidatus Binatia bacterium]
MISAARLAWLQLRRQKVRLAVALAGVAFAVVLMFMQFGFRDALFRSAVNVHQRLDADLVLVHPHYTIIALPIPIPRSRLYQALAFDGVESVTPLYCSLGRWKNPEDGSERNALVIGVDPAVHVLDVPGLESQRGFIRYPNAVLWDELSRPEFGPVASMFRADREVVTELAKHQVTVKGLVQLGVSFGIDATVITSDLNFLRIFPFRDPGAISAGLVRLRAGADAGAVRAALVAALPRDVDVLTKAEYMEREVGYWASATPIGYVFSFGVVMGLVVGSIIVYQILFTDISDHLAEYATLKAMGYANRFLAGVVLMEAAILAIAGFVPGLALGRWLYGLTETATMLPMRVSAERGGLVLVLTVVMCWVSGLAAMRKLRAADPADIF